MRVTLNAAAAEPVDRDSNVAYTYRYDAVDNLLAVTDPLGHTTHYDYDALDRLSAETDPLSNTWRYAYDAAGNRTRKTDALSQTTVYTYTALNQLEAVDYPDVDDATLVHDENGNLTRLADDTGAITWLFDELDRVTQQMDAHGRSLTYAYDAVGNRTSLTYPAGGTVTYGYLKNDWLAQVTTPAGETRYEHDGVGLTTKTTNPNRTVTTSAYDAANRLTALETRQASGALLARFDYAVDDVGLRASARLQFGRPYARDFTETYTYDPLRRLTGMTDSTGYVSSYQYDAAGNRVTWTANDDRQSLLKDDRFITRYVYNAADQLAQLQVDNFHPTGDYAFLYDYDANGNRVRRLWSGPGRQNAWSTDYQYDPNDRLIYAQDYRIHLLPGGQRSPLRAIGAADRSTSRETLLAYDGLGRRIDKEYVDRAGRGRVEEYQYTFDGLDAVATYQPQRGAAREEYYRATDRQLLGFQRFPTGDGGLPYWYILDGRQNVASIADRDGAVKDAVRYDAYGAILPVWENQAHVESHLHNTLTLTGKPYDDRLGMVEFGFRLYDASAGLWTNQDYLRGWLYEPRTLHRYQYVVQ